MAVPDRSNSGVGGQDEYRIPTYNRWLLHDADLGSAYRWHRRYLQHLQSRHPADQWLLKSPVHLWNLDALAAEYADDIFLGLDRGMEARDRATFPADQVVDVQFSEFVDDPFSTIHLLYAALGRELTSDTEQRMRGFLASNPGDGGGGGARYRFADTGLDADELRQRSARYQERFGVASEPVR